MTWQWNSNSGFQSSLAGFQIPNAEFLIPKPQAKTFPVLDTGFRIPDSGFRITLRYGTTNRENVRFVLLQNELNRAFSLTWSASCKFIETKEIVCIRKKFNVHRIGLRHQHGRRFIVLEHQYGRCDVMWKDTIEMLLVLPPTNQICLATNQLVAGCGK